MSVPFFKKIARRVSPLETTMDEAVAQVVPDRELLCFRPHLGRQRAEIGVVLEDHVDEVGIETEQPKPELVDCRLADQVADPARCMPGNSSATTTVPSSRVIRRISASAAA